MLDDDMKLIRSDPQLLTRICEQLVNENAAMNQALQERQESSIHTLQHVDPIESMTTATAELVPQVEDNEEENYYYEDMIQVDKKYDSMRDVRLAAIEYGRRHKFAVSTLRSGARQLVLACKHSGRYRGTKRTVEEEEASAAAMTGDDLPAVALQENEVEPVDDKSDSPTTPLSGGKRTRKKVSRKIQCPFQIRAKPVKGQWVVYKMDLTHNHPMAADSNAYAQHRKLNAETQKMIVKLMREGKTNTTIVKCLNVEGIHNVVRKDIANLRQSFFNPNSKGAAAASANNIPNSTDSNEAAVVAAAVADNNIEEHHTPQTEHQNTELEHEQQHSLDHQQQVPVAAVNGIDHINQHIEQLEQLSREHQKLHQESSEQEAH